MTFLFYFTVDYILNYNGGAGARSHVRHRKRDKSQFDVRKSTHFLARDVWNSTRIRAERIKNEFYMNRGSRPFSLPTRVSIKPSADNTLQSIKQSAVTDCATRMSIATHCESRQSKIPGECQSRRDNSKTDSLKSSFQDTWQTNWTWHSGFLFKLYGLKQRFWNYEIKIS